MRQQKTHTIRPVFIGMLVIAGIAAVAVWFFVTRESTHTAVRTQREEPQVDVSFLRSAAFQQLVMPRGVPVEEAGVFGRANPFLATAPAAMSTSTAQSPQSLSAPLEIVPLLPFPSPTTTTPPVSL